LADGPDQVSLEKRFELMEGYIKTVLSLSTGALILSITFLHDILGFGSDQTRHQMRGRCLVGGAWICFLGSIIASLFYLYFLAVAAKFENAYSGHLKWGARLSVFGFVGGLVLFGLFAWSNLP
jgi:hypothetical protein